MRAKKIVAVMLVIVASMGTHAGADLILPYDSTINTADPAFSITNSGSGLAIRGLATNTGNLINYGGYFEAYGKEGRGVTGATNGNNAWGVYGYALGSEGVGVYGESTHGIGVKGFTSGNNEWVPAIYGRSDGAGDGVYGWSKNRHGVFGVSYSPNHAGIYGVNNGGGYAAILRGNLQIRSSNTGAVVAELGEGLDYAEGFNVSDDSEIAPGMVMVIDSENPGRLVISNSTYDCKVAGIVAGAKGMGSGVRLGTSHFDCDVALAGRVYCNVDAMEIGVEPGDLLTTSATCGYAMKAVDYVRARGAILGKAMERLEKGKKGQILVLVTLQ